MSDLIRRRVVRSFWVLESITSQEFLCYRGTRSQDLGDAQLFATESDALAARRALLTAAGEAAFWTDVPENLIVVREVERIMEIKSVASEILT